jgi:hypothetical protein
MAMQAIQLITRIDSETGEVYVCAEEGNGRIVWLFPLKQTSTIMDYRGNRALVSPTGAQKVAEWGGTPVTGTDATGQNAYALIVIPGPDRTHLAASSVTNGAIISLDGGVTDHLPVCPGASVVFSGLYIPPQAGIYAKNAVAGSNYASLYVAVW